MYIIKKDQGTITKWADGTTRELFIYPQESSLEARDFIFRISSAKINTKHSVFTNFIGFDRYIIPLNGDLQIKHENGPYITLKPNMLHYFDGDVKTESIHTQKQLIDFNLIINKKYECDIKVIKSIDIKNISYSNYDIVLIYMLNSTASFNDIKLEKGDLLIIDEKKSINFTPDDGDIFIGKIKL